MNTVVTANSYAERELSTRSLYATLINNRVVKRVRMKTCIKCNLSQRADNFYKDSSRKDGRHPYCKTCDKKRCHNPKGLARKIYASQKHSSKTRGHVPPDYSFLEFYNWLINRKSFTAIFTKWQKSGFLKAEIPSPDRLNDKDLTH